MAKTVKQLRSKVCAFKERYPTASKTDIVRHFVDAGYACSGIYNILEQLDNSDGLSDSERQEAPKDAEEGKMATSLQALGWEVD